MTPEQYRAWRKAYDARRYLTKIKPERAVAHAAAECRTTSEAYRRGYEAGVCDENQRARQSFADFTQPSTTTPEQ